VRAIVPELAAQAAEGEQLRRIPAAAWAAIEETGVFRLMTPKCYGGYELDLDSFLEVGLAIAEADISTAWVTTFLIEHNWLFAQFPESFQKALYADTSYVLAPGAIAPVGGAKRVDGGYRLNGRWAWGTGVLHSTWVMVGGVTEAGGPESIRFFSLPISDITIDDTWHTDGMRATGSCDMVVEDVFVPEAQSVSVIELSQGSAPGASLHAAPLYRTPMIPVLMLAASMPLVGHAVTVAQRYQERLQEHTRMLSDKSSAHRVSSQLRIAQATLEARQAELMLRDVAADVMRLRNRASATDRARWAASYSHAVHQARRVVQMVAEGSGASAHFENDPLQRAHRDINMATCHIAFDNDAQRENYGRLLLGLEPATALS
jgi:alkylation response protein AidB-like acyl-CoA dehydrogenase